jgi:hypothetical protein
MRVKVVFALVVILVDVPVAIAGHTPMRLRPEVGVKCAVRNEYVAVYPQPDERRLIWKYNQGAIVRILEVRVLPGDRDSEPWVRVARGWVPSISLVCTPETNAADETEMGGARNEG